MHSMGVAMVMAAGLVVVPAPFGGVGTVHADGSLERSPRLVGLVSITPARVADARPGEESRTVDGQVQNVGELRAGGVLRVPIRGRARLHDVRFTPFDGHLP